MTTDADRTCQRTCWLLAAAGGVLVAILLVTLARMTFGLAALIAVVLAVALGTFLGWAFCTGRREATQEPLNLGASAGRAPASPFGGPLPPPTGSARSGPPPPATTAAPAPMPPAARSEPLPINAAATEGRTPLRPRTATRIARTTPGTSRKTGIRAAGLDMAVSKSKSPPRMSQPETLAAPRGGRADDLKQIVGIGPALERLLNEVGVWHFDQIASWKARDIAFIDSRIKGFKGRITRDGWVAQARILSARRPEDAR